MTNFVLVHGAWGGGHYDRMVKGLTAAGHNALWVRLKGMGTRLEELSPAITLSDHISDVLEQIEQAGYDKCVLVGHSYGGMIITGAADKLGSRVETLVYLDAFVPQDGEALWDLATDFERQHYIDGQRDAPGLVAPLPFIKDADRQRHPLLTITEPVRLSQDTSAIPRVFVYAKNGAPATFKKFRDRAEQGSGWTMYEFDGGHAIHVDQPDAVLNILLDLAN